MEDGKSLIEELDNEPREPGWVWATIVAVWVTGIGGLIVYQWLQ